MTGENKVVTSALALKDFHLEVANIIPLTWHCQGSASYCMTWRRKT